MRDWRATIAQLDALSRTRALTDAESTTLWKAIREERAHLRRTGQPIGRPMPNIAERVSAHAEAAATKYTVPKADVLGRGRHKPTVLARFEVMHRLREDGFSLLQIGRAMDRDHTTIMDGIIAYAERVAG